MAYVKREMYSYSNYTVNDDSETPHTHILKKDKKGDRFRQSITSPPKMTPSQKS